MKLWFNKVTERNIFQGVGLSFLKQNISVLLAHLLKLCLLCSSFCQMLRVTVKARHVSENVKSLEVHDNRSTLKLMMPKRAHKTNGFGVPIQEESRIDQVSSWLTFTGVETVLNQQSKICCQIWDDIKIIWCNGLRQRIWYKCKKEDGTSTIT